MPAPGPGDQEVWGGTPGAGIPGGIRRANTVRGGFRGRPRANTVRGGSGGPPRANTVRGGFRGRPRANTVRGGFRGRPRANTVRGGFRGRPRADTVRSRMRIALTALTPQGPADVIVSGDDGATAGQVAEALHEAFA